MGKGPYGTCLPARCRHMRLLPFLQHADLFLLDILHTCCSLYLECSFPRVHRARSQISLKSLLKCSFPRDPPFKEICLYLLLFCPSPWPYCFFSSLHYFLTWLIYFLLVYCLTPPLEYKLHEGSNLGPHVHCKISSPYKIVPGKREAFNKFTFTKKEIEHKSLLF